MIQINLLGLPKPKKGKRSASAASVPGEGPNPVILIGIALVLSFVVLGFMYMRVANEKATIEANMKKAQLEAQQLADAKVKADQMEAQSKLLDQRVKVIEDLRSKRSGPVDLLSMIGDTVNNTDGVWLTTMKEDGTKINLDGSALSVQQVANLMKNLQGTGYFKTVELKETAQDDQVKDMQQFNFTLTCEKADKPAQPTSGSAAPTTADKKM
jgi:type IV pilus assembly protein PilN